MRASTFQTYSALCRDFAEIHMKPWFYERHKRIFSDRDILFYWRYA